MPHSGNSRRQKVCCGPGADAALCTAVARMLHGAARRARSSTASGSVFYRVRLDPRALGAHGWPWIGRGERWALCWQGSLASLRPVPSVSVDRARVA